MEMTPLLGFILGGLEGIPLLASAILAVAATVRVCKRSKGIAIPFWLLLIWLVPLVGAIVALLVVKRPPPIAEVREHPVSEPHELAFEVRDA